MTETTETPAPDGTETPVSEAEANADSFSREYVQSLRDEAAQHRTEAKNYQLKGDALYEQLLTRSIEQATGEILYDPSDLPRDGDYENEDGFPDLEKIRTAAEELAERKPYLSRAGRGDIQQGARPDAVRVETLGELIRRGL